MVPSLWVRLAPTAIVLRLLCACASTDITAKDLAVEQRVYSGAPYGTVEVTAKGISVDRIYPLPDEVLRDAVSLSIVRAGLFSAAVGEGADYSLDVRVVDMPDPKPTGMGTMTVSALFGWTLRRNGEAAPLMEDVLETSCTKTGSDAFVGATRGTMAIVGAVQENLREGVARIAGALPEGR